MITGKAALAGVLGWPVAHSRSPLLHNHWIAAYGLDAAYVPLAVTPEDLPAAVAALKFLGFRGANVTVPHKEAVAGLVDWLDDSAEAIGAVNTIVREDGALVGTNTDAHGFLANLKQAAPHWRATKGAAVVLGAGGAARAAVYALRNEGVEDIRLVNRDTARAGKLARDLGHHRLCCTVLGWPETARALDGAQLLVNATSLGMEGQPALSLDLAGLPETAVVADLVYAPLETPLLAAARARRLTAVDGLGMLLHQAVPGFRAWFGVEPDVTPELRARLAADLVGRT